MNELIQAIDTYFQHRDNLLITKGKVHSISNEIVYVTPNGASKPIPCVRAADETMQPGMRVIMVRPNKVNQWTVVGVYFTRQDINQIGINRGVSGFKTGDAKIRFDNIDDGLSWLLCDGRTIGNTYSGSDIATPLMKKLFFHIWRNLNDTNLPIYTINGIASSRGGSPESDWKLDKRISLPDMRGRTASGMDNPGNGTGAANRVTNANADSMGGSMGAETHALTQAQMATNVAASSGWYTSGGAVGTSTTKGFINNASNLGAGAAHNNMQPTLFVNYFIYTGV